MIARNLKLTPTVAQRDAFEQAFWVATGAWNWLVRKIQLDARDGRFHSEYDLNALLKGHGRRCGLPQQTLEKLAKDVLGAWQLCWQGERGRPRLKGKRNRLASVPFRQGVVLRKEHHRIHVAGLGAIRYRHAGPIPAGRIKGARLCRKPRGWYLTLFIDAAPATITPIGDDVVGIDLGYETLAMLAVEGHGHERIEHPREQQRLARRLGQAQRGGGRRGRLAGRIQQRLANARRHRNHELSRMLVARFREIHISRDNLRGLQRLMGRSVLTAGHGQLITMTRTKGRQAGRVVTEPASRNSTRRCSSCGALTGPTGLTGLQVRQWQCGACGAHHDRDTNAAVNARLAGAVLAL